MQPLKTLLGKGFKLGTRGFLAAMLAVTALGLAAAPAQAATVAVNTTVDQSLGDCSVTCSLRDAVATANPGDTIAIPAGHYVLTLPEIGVDKDLTISGAGARTTVLDGNHMSRVFRFGDGTPATISDVALVNGLAEGDPRQLADIAGGALFGAAAPLKLERCLIANSQALAGGGVAWIGPATIDGCTFTGNQATGNSETSALGGGMFLFEGEHTISNSTFSGNAAPGGTGGGVAILDSTLHLFNVTLTANQAAPGAGGGIADVTGLPGSILANTIIAGNSGGDCSFPGAPAADHSLDSDGSCVSGPGNLPGVNPLLGPLANNGGPTDTQALLAGSPALDAGDNATCLATDQRGVARPQGPACDIGAFELVNATPPPNCSHATASPNLLWPANHKFVAIHIAGIVNPVPGAVTITVISIFQDEPTSGAADATGVGTANPSVRAERDGGGDGRVYHINFTATGASGSCTGSVTVGVPHDQGHGSLIDGGSLYNSATP